MVCKEEVYSWFQNLKGSKRIEAMSCFLNMCYPLELRFYGTCLEDLGRKDFYVFNDEEIKANDYSEILKIKNIHDSASRSKLIIVLSLLNSSNTVCAKQLFNVLSEEIKIETLISLGIFSDFNLVDQYLLVLTLAQHHPAFTFEQQTFLTHLSISVESYSNELQSRPRYEPDAYQPSSVGVPPQRMPEQMLSSAPQSFRYASPRYSNSHNQVQITSLKVKPPHKKTCVRIRVVWGGNKSTDAFKTPHDLFVFHQKLIQLYPTEAKNNNQDKCIPLIPHLLTVVGNKQNPLPENIVCAAAEYIQQLSSRLPGYVLESEFVRNFFMPSYPNRAVLTKNTRSVENVQNEIPPRSSRLRSLTIYNSQISENPPRHRPENRQKMPVSGPRKQFENGSNVCPQPSPINSPLESPLSSPYASPVNSATNSRAASPWNIANATADKNPSNACSESNSLEKSHTKEIPNQWNACRNYKIEELQTMPVEDLDSLNVLKDSSTVFKDLERKSPSNGIIGCYIPKGTLLLKSSPLLPSNSNDSSPACSEYSSPPQSPSPGEPCNQSSSLSSGNEETTEKRSLSKTLAEICKVDESGPSPQEPLFKRTDEEPVCMKGNMNRAAISVIPFAVPYSSIVPPPQNMKPAYLPIPCRTNTTPQHISPSTVVFDNQFSRVPLPSALTFIPAGLPSRSHAATSPGLSSVTTVSPFPIVTSGCTTVPSASCSITTHRSSNVTAVTNSNVGPSASSRYTSKNSNLVRDGEMPKAPGTETPYATGYILNSTSLTAVSCSCFTTNSARPSPAPSPSIMSGAPPQPSAVSVSMSYLGMPYLFHSIPFLQAQAPSNGFVQQPGIANSGQAFGYTLQNGITAISPELIYPGQTYTLQPPSTQGAVAAATPVTQCYGAFSQTSAVPIKLMTCYNCGKVGHRGLECKDQTMDDINKQGKFQLNYNPVPKMPDSHD